MRVHFCIANTPRTGGYHAEETSRRKESRKKSIAKAISTLRSSSDALEMKGIGSRGLRLKVSKLTKLANRPKFGVCSRLKLCSLLVTFEIYHSSSLHFMVIENPE